MSAENKGDSGFAWRIGVRAERGDSASFLDTSEGVSPALCRRAFVILSCRPAELGFQELEMLASEFAFESDRVPLCSKGSQADPHPYSHM